MIEARGVGMAAVALAALLGATACGSGAQPPPGPSVSVPPKDAGGRPPPAGGGPMSPAPAADAGVDRAPGTPAADAPPAADAAPPDAGAPPPRDGPAGETDPAPSPDMGPDADPGLGPFPLATVRAARPERLVSVATPCEGPSWRDGEVFFGFRDGLMRISADRKLYRYVPQLVFSVGTTLLGDGSLLVCDRTHKLVQVHRDGKVAVLADDSATNSNDVTVDGTGNIFFSDFRTAIFRITPAGEVTRALSNLASPNGVEVDPQSRFLYFMSGARVMRAALPTGGGGFGPVETVVSLEAGGDGCAFDAWGQLWVAVHDAGRLAIVDVGRRQIVTSIGAGGTSVTNVSFGGPNHDEVFTTVSANGVFRIPVGAKGFAGHRGATRYTPKRMLDITPANEPVP